MSSFVQELLAEFLYPLPVGSWPECFLARRTALEIGEAQGNEKRNVPSGLFRGDVVENIVAEWAAGREGKGKAEDAFQFAELFGRGFSHHKVRPFLSGSSKSPVSGKEDSPLQAGNSKEFSILHLPEVGYIVS